MANVIKNNPRLWHEILSEVLWAYRTSKKTSTRISPYAFTFGHEAVLPMKIKVNSLRVMKQNYLTLDAYQTVMSLELEDTDEERVRVLNNILVQKRIAAKGYNKKVKHRTFDEGDLVWKTILPIGSKNPKYGKWSPKWEGPFQIHKGFKGEF